MKLLLIDSGPDRLPEKWLNSWLKGLSFALKSRGLKLFNKKELVLVFVTASEMKRLNRLYRGHDKTTDVLSFQSADPDCLGELVLCLQVIKKQSKRTGLSPRGELGFMVVHGVLHLLGYDHEKPDEETKMFALQEQIYAQLVSRVGLR